MTKILLRDEDGHLVLPGRTRQDFDANFSQGLPAGWETDAPSGGAVAYGSLVDTAGFATLTTGPVSGNYAALVGPALRLSRHRWAYLTVRGLWGQGDVGDRIHMLGLFTPSLTDGGIVLREDSQSDTRAQVQVRRSSGAVTLPQPFRLLSSERNRKQTWTLLVYKPDDESLNGDWWMAVIDGELETGEIVAGSNAKISGTGAAGGASLLDTGTVRPRLSVNTRAAAPAVARVTSMRFGVGTF